MSVSVKIRNLRGVAWRAVEPVVSSTRTLLFPLLKKFSLTLHMLSEFQLYKSMIGPDGWRIHYEKSTRKCSIYPDRPYFCHVEPEVFKSLYGINKKKFNKEACSCCRDTIKAIYGSNSKELYNFNNSIRGSTS